ncbi:MAG: HAMP domain-containing protein [Verrucomicrobiales bacterium]
MQASKQSSPFPHALPWYRSIRFRALFALALVVLLVVVATAATGFFLRRAELLEEFQARTLSIAATGALAFEGSDLELLDSADAIHEPEFLLNKERLMAIRDANNLRDTEIYILRPLEDFRESFATIFLVMPGEENFFGNRYVIEPENRDAFLRTLDEGRSQSTGIYEDAEGTWISSYGPIRNFEGEVVAVLEVDAEITRYLDRSLQILGSEIGVGFFAFALVLLPGMFLVNHFTSGLVKLNDAIKSFETGKEDIRVNLKTGDEVEQVAQSFNLMADNLAISRVKLEKSNQELGLLASELQQELSLTNTIMATVQEGLCLIRPDGVIEGRYSAAMESMFGRNALGQIKFLDIIRNRVTSKTYDLTERFLKLVFQPEKNNHLLPRLNPLKEVEITLQQKDGGLEVKFYAFHFDRVWESGQIKQALVTVSDVTPRIALTRELKQAAQRMERQAELLFGVIHIQPKVLGEFITRSHSELEAISHSLREAIDTSITPAQRQEEYRRQVESLMRRVHRIKGDAAQLKAHFFENAAHEIEEKLIPLRSQPSIDGTAFVPVVLALSQMIQHFEEVKEVVSRVGNLKQVINQPDGGDSPPRDSRHQGLFGDMAGLLKDLSQRTGKEIYLRSVQVNVDNIPESLKPVIRESAIQLARNAAVHGAETAEARSAAGKSPRTALDLEVFRTEYGLRVVVRDDGRGLDYQALADRALEMEAVQPGLLESLFDAEQQVWHMDKLADIIFRPGFSTLDQANLDAGRGTGLDLVKSRVEEVGGLVRVISETGHHTTFIVDFPSGLA